MKHLSFNLISIYSLNIAHKFYLKYNLNLDELYHTCNISYQDLQDEHNQITVETFIKSIQLIKNHTLEDIDLAQELEKHLCFSDFGSFGFTLLAAPRLADGLDLLIQGFSIMEPNFEFKKTEKDNFNFELSIENPGSFKEFNEDILDLSILMLKKYVRCFFTNISEKEFNEKHIKHYQTNNNIRKITIDKELLSKPSVMSHPTFFKYNKIKILKKSKHYKNIVGCVLNVHKLIRYNLRKGHKPSLNDIAVQLGTSTKTLSRLLKSHDTSFQICLDQVICDEAINLIKAEFNTKEIAYTLGFQSIAGLNYLFIKKYGLTLNQLKGSLSFS